jgi:hypothetical protein
MVELVPGFRVEDVPRDPDFLAEARSNETVK